VDVRLGWRPLKCLELSVTGQNLVHAHHPEYGFPTAADREDISRSVYAKAVLRF
jgi:iron complex outermembrane receptor protein